MHHELKCFHEDFQAIRAKQMKAMVRFNDRRFSVNDTFTLYEGWADLNSKDNFHRTGQSISGQISHLSTYAVQPGYIVISIDKLGLLIIGEDQEKPEETTNPSNPSPLEENPKEL